MNPVAVCPECGEMLAADSPMGLCPRCLLRPMVDPALTVLNPQPTEVFDADPGSAEGLARLFPQLEIIERIGQGGMGVVYKARQIKFQRLVALKVIRPELASEPGFAERFTREAMAMGRLVHPNIVTIHDFGDVDGTYYLLMELVEGGDLRQALKGGRLAVEAALVTALQICDALRYAHDRGVIHRDIKPENVLLDARGMVKIADFGLAKLLEPPTGVASLTATRQVMGTPAYMAPEQFLDTKQVNHRADIYSVGVLLYEMLTGQVPFGRFELPSEVLGTDEDLDEILVRALQRDPAKRQAGVGDLRAELATFAEEVYDLKAGWSSIHLGLGSGPPDPAPTVLDGHPAREEARVILARAKEDSGGCLASLIMLAFVWHVALSVNDSPRREWTGFFLFGLIGIWLLNVSIKVWSWADGHAKAAWRKKFGPDDPGPVAYGLLLIVSIVVGLIELSIKLWSWVVEIGKAAWRGKVGPVAPGPAPVGDLGASPDSRLAADLADRDVKAAGGKPPIPEGVSTSGNPS